MTAVGSWALHLALVSALGALVLARNERGALLLFVPLALAPALSWRRAPRWLVRLLPVVVHFGLVAAFALAVLSHEVPLVSQEAASAWVGAVGWLLAVVGVVLVLGRDFWSPSATLVPVVVALLVLSALGSGADLFAWFGGAGALALWTFALVGGGPRRVDRSLFVFGVLSAGAVAGVVVFLPWAQRHVERAVLERLVEGTTGLSGGSRLGEFARLAASRRVVLRVWTPSPRLLRGYVLTRFDGREWRPDVELEQARARPVLPLGEDAADLARRRDLSGRLFALPPHQRLPSPTDALVETRVVHSVVEDWPLLVPAGAVIVHASAPRLEPNGSGGFRWPRLEPAWQYSILGWSVPSGEAAALGSDERAVTLGLPSYPDPRLRIRARILSDGARSDRERLERTVRWLQSSFSYTLDTGAFETHDPLAEFLFQKKKGYCEYFATAAAVLLRLQGVPSRYVKGFAVGPHNAVGDHHRVRDSHAHAWIDAYLPGEGWVEADPTPPAAFAARHAERHGRLDEALEAVRATTALSWARFQHEGLRGLVPAAGTAGGEALGAARRRPRALAAVVVVLALALLGARLRAFLVEWRSRRRLRHEREAALPSELRELLRTTERHWAGRGRPRPPSRGLREHLDSMPSEALSAEARAASERVVEAVYRAAYGEAAPPAGGLADLRRDVARLG